jgi:putative tryptophan/tyrosine transport system substrate-binding protein
VRRRDFIAAFGGAVAWPVMARAQQPERVRRVAFLTSVSENDPESRSWIKALTQRLEELGWMGSRNIRIDYRFGEADATRMPGLAKELVELRPDVIVASTGPAARAMRQLTLSIPIVFVQVPDPVSVGFVTNLAHPSGNITGFTNFEFSIGGKWLQLIKECAPRVNRVLIVFDPDNPTWTAYLRTIEEAAPSFGVQLIPAAVSDPSEVERDVVAFSQEPNGAVVVLPSPVTVKYREAIIATMARHRLAAVYPYRFFAAEGGFTSYGVDVSDLYRRAAYYVDRILKGVKPADLPVQAPTKFELVINLKTAKALGIEVPPSLLGRADEVIE